MDFEVTEEFLRNGETRIRYPHRQEKIVEVTRSIAPDKQPAHFNAAIAGTAFVPHLRDRFAADPEPAARAQGHSAPLQPTVAQGVLH
ncbi:hypothetical protein AB5I41_16500 [Sphingomonas sp. MMS24-JH45]